MWPRNDVHMDDGSMTPEDQEPVTDNDMEYNDNGEESSYSNGSSSSYNADKLSSSRPLQHKLDLSASPSRNNDLNPRVEHLIALFKDLSSAEQMDAFTRLLQESNMTNIRQLRAIIEPHFQRDFLSCLPVELGMKILHNLTGYDLLKVAQVSKNWKLISEIDKIWKSLGVEEFKHHPDPTDRVTGAWQGTAIAAGVTIPDHIQPCDLNVHRFLKLQKFGDIFERAADKSRYLRADKIEKNWNANPIMGSAVLRGHEDHVITCMQIHDDVLVTGSDDNTLKVWCIDKGEVMYTLVGHTGGVWTSQISQCGRYIVSGSTDRTVKVWSTVDGSLLHTLQGHTSTVRCMAMAGSILVTGSRDTTLRVWDVESGRHLATLHGHHAAVRCVQFDGTTVVSGGYDFTVKIWNAHTGRCIRTLTGHNNRVYSLLFESERSIVCSGSLDTSIRVWDFTRPEGQECVALLQGHTSLTSGMQLRGNILVSCNADSHVRVWDIHEGTCVHMLSGHRSAITSLQWFGRNMVATSSDDGTVKLWDIERGALIRDLVTLDSGGNGGCIWRLCSTSTMLACAVGSRNNTEETKVILLDFDAVYP
ncbi:F-box/WD repeat-containing protein sel-10 [Caenorhabditis elegans]|uniref:F-box/WD repeat-containing protein sel-10 n=1 Tax=Caenorhabditis elegans TaxID=6239 RepID=SEL10_CAEEL|nr:F-box/WD repeat-containing protein sel-10 [Caenorhabditis elegans]Q93794.3 RecName: Full=F-box/WD repeat-containing protein sel-10; AltName: Full=Egg laying defective protein 41; AltName: Full=Suppressor/enhancer of lin-12 protein 10 [Caenorhabditis elegans]AAC47809.1 SEL-10 [Caenorhabditis elegans]CAB02129.2 F-box/WD repeat-containing protein sel-10 [Caenorhabditis elegans]|eukprot:NP_506421.1 F-box/WD repeat-containing protein sel-10 [Caenorhabditis elegans]